MKKFKAKVGSVVYVPRMGAHGTVTQNHDNMLLVRLGNGEKCWNTHGHLRKYSPLRKIPA